MAVYTVEKVCPRRRDPHLTEEEHRNLTFAQAVAMVDDLAAISDPEGIDELEPGEQHSWEVDETWADEVIVRRES